MTIISIKYMISVLFMVIVALAFSACGVNYGNFTAGTTGFLRESNKAKVIADYETINRENNSKLVRYNEEK